MKFRKLGWRAYARLATMLAFNGVLMIILVALGQAIQ